MFSFLGSKPFLPDYLRGSALIGERGEQRGGPAQLLELRAAQHSTVGRALRRELDLLPEPSVLEPGDQKPTKTL